MTKKIAVKTALFSVTDKEGIKEFAQGLRQINPHIAIIASGGTAKALAEAGIAFTPLSDYTQFPECFQGRVKTVHPRIIGGTLFCRGRDDIEAEKLGISPIDLVVCNLYNFAQATQRHGLPMQELVESMDIGGSTLIRSASKNFADVAVAVDPKDYMMLLEELKKNEGCLSLETRQRLAVKAMNVSADYETLLAREFTKRLGEQESHRPSLARGRRLRYGENPDQQAWVYQFEGEHGIAQAKVLSGKELSYNNYDDATLAYYAAFDLKERGAEHGAAIVKHGSLCAYATGKTIAQAFEMAWAGDSKSAFGSIIALTSSPTEQMIHLLQSKFVEVIIAPHFNETFVAWAQSAKPNLRLLEMPFLPQAHPLYKSISGGMLVQTQKNRAAHPSIDILLQPSCDKRIGVVTKNQPKAEQQGLYGFAISAVQFAKSNAIAIVREYEPGSYQLLSIGAGQPNRIDSLQRLATPKAIENLLTEHSSEPKYNPQSDLGRCVMASDGFFPFDDSIHFAAAQGIRSIVQPGGSTRDEEVIKAADEQGLCMLFTGERYFYH